MLADWIIPNWPAPEGIKALSTTRRGGFSTQGYTSLNLGHHVGDNIDNVRKNRTLLQTVAAMPCEPKWLEQTHGVRVIDADNSHDVDADAAMAQDTGTVCVVLTADCLPILLCHKKAHCVASIHAGWRGLAAGVIENTVTALNIPGNELFAWLGPAIGPDAFEVGDEVKAAFVHTDPKATTAFKPSTNERWLADLYQLARLRLKRLGIHGIYGGDYCTYSDPEHFFSYRRDTVTGRMGTFIWINGVKSFPA